MKLVTVPGRSDFGEGRHGDQGQSWHGIGLISWFKGVLSFSRLCTYLLNDRLGPQCPGSILLQKYR